MIEKLTPEQETLLPIYRDKWRAIALNTQPLDREKATRAIAAVYNLLGKNEPQIILCKNIATAFKTLEYEPINDLGGQLGVTLEKELIEKQELELWEPIRLLLWRQLEYFFIDTFLEELDQKIGREPSDYEEYWNYIDPFYLACYGSLFDFTIGVLNSSYNSVRWEVFKSLVMNCGGIFPYENICVVSVSKGLG
jgi:hypothetical protein